MGVFEVAAGKRASAENDEGESGEKMARYESHDGPAVGASATSDRWHCTPRASGSDFRRPMRACFMPGRPCCKSGTCAIGDVTERRAQGQCARTPRTALRLPDENEQRPPDGREFLVPLPHFVWSGISVHRDSRTCIVNASLPDSFGPLPPFMCSGISDYRDSRTCIVHASLPDFLDGLPRSRA